MKKIIDLALPCVFIIALGAMFLTACTENTSRNNFFSSDKEVSNAQFEELLEAIKNRDREAVKMVFSKKAQEEADDFESGIDSLFDFFQGEVESWEKDVGSFTEDSIHYGERIKNVSSYYNITTDEGKYFFYIKSYHIDTYNFDNVGIYMLIAMKEEDWMKAFDYDQKIIVNEGQEIEVPLAGILVPLK